MSNVGITKVVILVGSGFAGSVLISRNQLGEFLNDISKVFSKHLKNGETGEGDSGGSSLSSQVQRLSQEIRSLASLPRSDLTVVQAGPGSGVSITPFVLPAAVLGALSYGWMKWRGYCFTDLLYVTRKGLNDAVATVGKQLENVSAGLSSARKHLNQRLDTVNTKLDDSIVMTEFIKGQVEDVKGTVGRSVLEIENVNLKIEGLGLKMDEVQESQNFANQGIFLLIEWVHGLNVVRGSNVQAELGPGFKSWYQKAIAMEKTSKFGSSLGSPGLKQLFSEPLEPPPANHLLEMAPAGGESRPPIPLNSNLPTPGLSTGASKTFSTSVLSREKSSSRFSGS